MESYTQCELRQGDKVHIAFIPTTFAKKGRVVTIDDLEGDWTVTQAYSKITREQADEQRKVTKRFQAVLGKD